jgi:hypothetical protein
MKSAVRVLVILIISFVMFNGCNQNSTQPPVNQDNSNYFPNGDGTYYKYSTEVSNANGTNTVNINSTTYSGSALLRNTNYQRQIDTVVLGLNATSISYFRKSSAGTYYFLDTTGISKYIPATYSQALTFSTELQILNTPLSDGLKWQAYKVGVPILQYNFIDVEATYLGKENVTLNLLSGAVTVSAAKMQYIMTLQFPNPNNILGTPAKGTFIAYGWFAADIGPVKWSGNSIVLNSFSGTGINLSDTTKNVSQDLIYYSIK